MIRLLVFLIWGIDLIMPTVSFQTLGCKLNQAETDVLAGQFAGRGYQVVPWGEESDVSVLNTCTVTSRSDSKCRQAVNHILRLHPKSTVIVVGCYPQVAHGEIENLPGVDYIFGTYDKFRLFDFFKSPGKRVKPLVVVSSPGTQKPETLHSSGISNERTRAFLKIQSGCSRNCAYCIVPFARGPARSLPMDVIIRQARELIAQGFREIVLTGTHIADYGRDLDGRSHLTDLIRALIGLGGMGRIRLSSLDPEDLDDPLVNLIVSSPTICRHVHLSIQSGSNTILKAMNRKHAVELYRRRIDHLVKAVGLVGLGTDIITGFPGETDALFEETVHFIESLPFTYLHVFPFSPRKETPAASMTGQVPPQVRIQRAERLRQVAFLKKEHFQRQWINRTADVLMENRNRNNRMSGLSSEYVRVEIPYDPLLVNQFVSVRIESVQDGFVRGKVI